MSEQLWALAVRYADLLQLHGPRMAVAMLFVSGCMVLAERDERWKGPVGAGLLGAALLLGASEVRRQASVFDDAFISFRYIRNLLAGNGMVYNTGEYVEGYTNPLWCLLIAGVSALTGIEIPLAAVVLNVLVYLGLIAAAYRFGLRLSPDRPIPLAACLIAVQMSITAYATTGMETLFGALLVLMGAWALSEPGRQRAIAAGVIFALAVVHRLDHALFWVAGFLAVGVGALREGWREVLRTWAGYLVPVLLVVLYLACKVAYYGDLLPNTFYAKEAHGLRADQGLLYFLTFAAGSHAQLLLVPLLAFLWLARRTHLALVSFVVLASGAWFVFLLKVGGDFMYARFCLPLFPLLLVCAAAGAWRLADRWMRVLATASLAASLGGMMMIPRAGKMHHWGQANESRVYPLMALSPLRVGHPAADQGLLFHELFTERGIDVYLGSCCVGMVGYYAMQPLLDFHGLTDAKIARKPMDRTRRLSGHEKMASVDEVRARGVRLARWEGRDPEHLRDVARVRFPGRRVYIPGWSFVTWDDALMERLDREVPELEVTHFPTWLDTYLKGIDSKSERELRADYTWFKAYYFDHNQDLRRENVIRAKLGEPLRKPKRKRKKGNKAQRGEARPVRASRGLSVDVPQVNPSAR